MKFKVTVCLEEPDNQTAIDAQKNNIQKCLDNLQRTSFIEHYFLEKDYE